MVEPAIGYVILIRSDKVNSIGFRLKVSKPNLMNEGRILRSRPVVDFLVYALFQEFFIHHLSRASAGFCAVQMPFPIQLFAEHSSLFVVAQYPGGVEAILYFTPEAYSTS